MDLINNFCIAVPSNEQRCSQCHAGIGFSNDGFDFADASTIDCLVCHDTTGTYVKSKTTAGAPEDGIDLHEVAINIGTPSRQTCGACHFTAGGGDNVKHGDLAKTLINADRDADVHMGVNGLNFTCQACHRTADHRIAGFGLHSTDEGTVACQDCHNADNLHASLDVINVHLDSVACEACHIPAIARTTPTKVYWDWSEAGQDIDPIPTDEYGKPTYDKKKGSFRWAKNVRPELRWHNGKWNRVVIGDAPHYDQTPVMLATPVGDIADPTAKLYPFKKMEGKSPADPVNRIMLVPHLFGPAAGPNAYWAKYDWDLALAEGAAYAGQDYSGEYAFVDTVMYLQVSHEIAPKEQALGCTDCHAGGIDFVALGYDRDPWEDTGRN
jgi:octaheme c-type cytochrome (tetrathionate reductase family)